MKYNTIDIKVEYIKTYKSIISMIELAEFNGDKEAAIYLKKSLLCLRTGVNKIELKSKNT